MAFAIVGTPTHFNANGTGPVVLTKPSGVAQNDILFALLQNVAAPTGVPSGWALAGYDKLHTLHGLLVAGGGQ